MKDYTKYTLGTDNELVIAQLYALEFDSFQEVDGRIEAYILDELNTITIQNTVADICAELKVEYQVEQLENKNWNEIWESNFEPVSVGSFCKVRADFHNPDHSVSHDIIINPKMAFGTGHHETTYMMIETMANLQLENKSVFDFGCGTSVLAILAKRMGSGRTLAIDIEEESASNSVENAAVNHVHGIDIRQATIDEIEDENFDVILANINRQVLLDTAEDIARHQSSGDVLLVSGVMLRDEDIVNSRFESVGYIKHDLKNRGEWLCFHYIKK